MDGAKSRIEWNGGEFPDYAVKAESEEARALQVRQSIKLLQEFQKADVVMELLTAGPE